MINIKIPVVRKDMQVTPSRNLRWSDHENHVLSNFLSDSCRLCMQGIMT